MKKEMKFSKRMRHEIDFPWPKIPFNIVLVNPMIPPNTGNIARLCAATHSVLHLIKPLGFDISDKQLKRAGLDYWNKVDLIVHENIYDYFDKFRDTKKYFFSTAAKKDHAEINYTEGDHLIFGNEPLGLSDEIINSNEEYCCNIPIKLNAVRSLNLSNAVSIALYTALRKIS